MANMWLVPGEQTGYALVVASAKGVNVERVRQIVGEIRNEAQRSTPQTWFTGWVRQIQGYGF